MPAVAKSPLLGLSADELKQVALELGLPAFVGKQIAGWIYGKRVTEIAQMTNLSKQARALLDERFCIGCTPPVDKQESVDGTIKYLYTNAQGKYIESVYIPDGDRATLCISSQVGCKMHCAFCMTGRLGFNASLTTAEILNQIYSLPEYDRLTNVVYMGQGEPFDNLDNVLRSTRAITAEWGWGWSPKRITVSSVGLAKGLVRFLNESKCHLAISLHHPIPEGRAMLMPAERSFGIKDVVGVLKQHEPFRKHKRHVDTRWKDDDITSQRRLSFEYIVFAGINDTKVHADELLHLLRDLDCRINLIRFHDIPDTPLRGVSKERMLEFRDYLTSHGLFTTLRASRGEDIFAACGLLSAKKQEADNQH